MPEATRGCGAEYDNDRVAPVAFSPDDSSIVSGSWDQTIKVWDAGTLACHIPHPNPKLSAPTLATASLELKAEKQSAHSDRVSSVAFSPDGATIVSGSADNTIKVWDAGSLACQIPHPAQN